jgi:5-methylcytosine-specific restriction endonuclease McrA
VGRNKIATSSEMYELLEQQEFLCALTGQELVCDENGDNSQCDHKTPIKRGGTNEKENLQWIRTEINAAKGTMTNEEFIEMCQRVVNWTSSTTPHVPAIMAGPLATD